MGMAIDVALRKLLAGFRCAPGFLSYFACSLTGRLAESGAPPALDKGVLFL